MLDAHPALPARMHRVAQEVLLVLIAREVRVARARLVADGADAVIVLLAVAALHVTQVIPLAMHRKDAHERLEAHLATDLEKARKVLVLILRVVEVLE